MYGYNAEQPIAIPIYTVLPYCVKYTRTRSRSPPNVQHFTSIIICTTAAALRAYAPSVHAVNASVLDSRIARSTIVRFSPLVPRFSRFNSGFSLLALFDFPSAIPKFASRSSTSSLHAFRFSSSLLLAPPLILFSLLRQFL